MCEHNTKALRGVEQVFSLRKNQFEDCDGHDIGGGGGCGGDSGGDDQPDPIL